MTIHPAPDDGSVPVLDMGHRSAPPQAVSDTESVYDSTWTQQPDTQEAEGLNRVMGADGKIYVVLAVVLIIWFGLLALLVRTDRKIDDLERRLDSTSSERDVGE